MVNDIRIALIQTSKTLTSRNGITTSVENFLDFIETQDNIIVDLILDKKDNFVIDFDQYERTKVYYPENPIADNIEAKLCGMFRYPISLEKSINIKNAYLQSLKFSVHDFIFLNSEELFIAFQNMGLKTPIFLYTHFGHFLEFNAKGFLKQLNDLISSQKDVLNILTQTEQNEQILLEQNYSNVKIMPLLQTKRIYEIPGIPKDGILFNGRLSAPKRFEDFMQVVKVTGKKALIMTPTKENLVKKKLHDFGITNYEIGINLKDDERNVFMNKAEYCFHPSSTESFGYAPAESLLLCDTILLGKYDWTRQFVDKGAIICDSIESVIDVIKRKVQNSNRISQINDFYNSVVEQWKSFITQNKCKVCESKGKMLLEYKSDIFYLKDFFSSMSRDMTYADYDSIRKQCFSPKFKIIQEKEGSKLCRIS